MRGASRGVLEVGQRRRPRAGFASLHSGGPGQPSAGTMTGCLQWLDAAGTKAGGSPPDKGRQWRRPLLSRPEARRRGQKRRTWSAEWRARLFARRADATPRRSPERAKAGARRWTEGGAARRSIPSLFLRGATPPRPLLRGARRVTTAPPRRKQQGRRSVGLIRLILRV